MTILLNPYLITSFGILIWSGNFVVGRYANVDIPPVSLSFWRHFLAFIIIIPFVLPYIKKDWPEVRARMAPIFIMGFLLAAGNTLVYFAIMHTTVTNAALINAGVPVATIAFSWVLLRDIINRWQACGILIAFAGITIVVTKAQINTLLGLQLGLGDLFMLASVFSWALYLVMLKRGRVNVDPWTLLFVLTGAGAAWLAPAYVVELSLGYRVEWSVLTLVSLGYVVFFSTIIGWACVNYGTFRLGPNRASAFMCLHPIFGAILGSIFFGEIFREYHWIGTVLVLIGVFLVSRAYADETTRVT